MGSLRKLTKRRKGSTQTNISSLPRDLLASILASVASSSAIDLFQAKSTCKEFHKATEDVLVYKRVSLDFMPATSWKVLPVEALSFLKQCEESGNPEIFYRHGMIKYFSREQSEVGCQLLKKASESGHTAATYAIGIILFSDQHTKSQGEDLLNNVDSTKSDTAAIDKCRERSQKILHEMWVSKNIPLLGRRREDNCSNWRCRNGGMIGWPSKEQWSWDGTVEKGCYSFCSLSCKWSYEFNFFCDLIDRHGA